MNRNKFLWALKLAFLWLHLIVLRIDFNWFFLQRFRIKIRNNAADTQIQGNHLYYCFWVQTKNVLIGFLKWLKNQNMHQYSRRAKLFWFFLYNLIAYHFIFGLYPDARIIIIIAARTHSAQKLILEAMSNMPISIVYGIMMMMMMMCATMCCFVSKAYLYAAAITTKETTSLSVSRSLLVV